MDIVGKVPSGDQVDFLQIWHHIVAADELRLEAQKVLRAVGYHRAFANIEEDVGVFSLWCADDLDKVFARIGMKCVFVFLNDYFNESIVQALALRAERGIDVEAAVDTHFGPALMLSEVQWSDRRQLPMVYTGKRLGLLGGDDD